MFKKKKLIFFHRDAQNSIYVYENKVYRWLSFDEQFIQTAIEKNRPQIPILNYILPQCVNLKESKSLKPKILILGAGGGAHFHYIKHLLPNAELQMVEINPVIIEIAKLYFMVNHPIQLIDAQQFVKNQQQKYDHIILDMFIDQNFPQNLLQETFINNCIQICQGVLSINIISINRSDTLCAIQKLRELFSNKILTIPVANKSNLIVHAFNNEQYFSKIKGLYQNQRITKPIWREPYGLVSQLQDLHKI